MYHLSSASRFPNKKIRSAEIRDTLKNSQKIRSKPCELLSLNISRLIDVQIFFDTFAGIKAKNYTQSQNI